MTDENVIEEEKQADELEQQRESDIQRKMQEEEDMIEQQQRDREEEEAAHDELLQRMRNHRREESDTLRDRHKESINVKKNAKGDVTWDVKVYGDATTEEGVKEMEDRLKALVKTAKGRE